MVLGISVFAIRNREEDQPVPICQTDYTRMNYKDGYYYYQSSADHFYLYKSDGKRSECLAEQVPKDISKAVKREIYGENDFYGVWHIDKAVLQSKMYAGTTQDGDFEKNLYDPEDYIGLEVEYDPEYFRLGSERYNSPEYVFTSRTVKDVNDGGKFYNPDIYEFLLDESIEVIHANHYDSLAEVPLLQIEIRFSKEVSYDNYDFIPVGTQCIILDEDTMLIGLWGKSLLAHRIM